MNRLISTSRGVSGTSIRSLRQVRLVSSSVTTPAPPPPTDLTDPPSKRQDRSRLFSHRLFRGPGESYPKILNADPVLDAWVAGEGTSDSQSGLFSSSDPSIKYYNSPSIFPPSEAEEKTLQPKPLIPKHIRHTYVLLRKRVVHQTGKGKIATMYFGVVVGNGNGVVGFGDAKSDDQGAGTERATQNALKNCDAVELFEGRTIWTDMRIKFGSTELHLRPRPRGFGLMCNPYVHQVCKAAGIKDISAKVHGSRNPMAVIKATLMLLHSGGAPINMGNGTGGTGKREQSKQGIKSQATMERERGRAFMEGGSWI